MSIVTGQRVFIDEDIEKVLIYMQENIATERLIGVAESVLSLAQLLWKKYPQKPLDALASEAPEIV